MTKNEEKNAIFFKRKLLLYFTGLLIASNKNWDGYVISLGILPVLQMIIKIVTENTRRLPILTGFFPRIIAHKSILNYPTVLNISTQQSRHYIHTIPSNVLIRRSWFVTFLRRFSTLYKHFNLCDIMYGSFNDSSVRNTHKSPWRRTSLIHYFKRSRNNLLWCLSSVALIIPVWFVVEKLVTFKY